jgi:hypothetical protein
MHKVYTLDIFEDEYGKDCSVLSKTVNGNHQINVEYNGREIRTDCVGYSFIGRKKDSLNEYEVCVTPLNFSDPNCVIRLDYKSSDNGEILQVKQIDINQVCLKKCAQIIHYMYITTCKSTIYNEGMGCSPYHIRGCLLCFACLLF